MPRATPPPKLDPAPYAVWLRENLSQRSGLSDAQLAHRLGYKSPLFIELLRQGHLDVSIERFVKITLMTKAQPEEVFALWRRDHLINADDENAEAVLGVIKAICERRRERAGYGDETNETLEGGR